MNITGGSTDVTTYFVLRTAADGTETTGATITDIDLQYVRTGVAPSTKADATALAATDSAHADNKAIEIDGTDAPGLYRVDWPDAAFAAGVKQVILTVKLASSFTEHMAVDIDPPVGAAASVTAGVTLANDAITAAKFDQSTAYPANEAIVTYKLDHLVYAADGDDPANNSIIAMMAATGGDWSTFAKATDSLQSIKDGLPAAIMTALWAETPTAGAATTFQNIVKGLWAWARGRVAKSTDDYEYYDDDGDVSGGTKLFENRISSSARTPQ